jgi:DNA repair protein RadD
MILRENQVKPVQVGIEFFSLKDAKPSIIVAPTAFGKSILVAKIAEGINDKVIVLQPSKELLEQNYNKYISMGYTAGIYSASFGQKDIKQVTFATIGSIKSIGAKFKALNYTKLIIDECDQYPRDSNSMLGTFLKESGITHVLGLTATALKLQQNYDIEGNKFSKLVMLTSKSKMGNFYHDIIYVAQIQEMVKLGFWAKLKYELYNSDGKHLVLNTNKSEYTEESVIKAYEHNNIQQKIIKAIDINKDRNSILVFVPSVAQAKHLQSLVPDSLAVYGDMPDKERDIAIFKFKTGITRVIFNVNVLSIGFDHPQLDCIILGKYMNSFSRYYQIIGRGTRIHPDKHDCLIIDFTSTVKKFGRVEYIVYHKDNVWKLFGENGRQITGVPLDEIKPPEQQTTLPLPKELTMPFGKYKGKPISQIDKSYLNWLIKENIITTNNHKNEILNTLNPTQ